MKPKKPGLNPGRPSGSGAGKYTKTPGVKYGGYRPGGGRPKVDKRVEYTSVSYPKKFDAILRPMVKAKVKELKDAQKGLKAASAEPVTVTLKRPEKIPTSYTLHGKDVTSVKKNKEGGVTITTPIDKVIPKPSKQMPESDYLKQRRKAKQGLK